MNRLFTFGCSFTKYNWAMWPELVNFEYNPSEFYNFGRCGAGNQYIAHKVALANQIYNFTSDDMVMICWTHIFRKDWFEPYGLGQPHDGWQCNGNVFHPGGLNFFIDKRLHILEDFLAKDLLTITNTIKLLDTCKIPNHQMQIVSVFETTEDSNTVFDNDVLDHTEIKPLLEYCQPKIGLPYDNFIDTHELWFKYFPDDAEKYVADYHPMPEHHMEYLSRVCGMSFSDATVTAAKKCQDYTFEYIKKHRNEESYKDFNTVFQDYDDQDRPSHEQGWCLSLENFRD